MRKALLCFIFPIKVFQTSSAYFFFLSLCLFSALILRNFIFLIL
ncbi:Hypothetical protein EHI5A_209240 [Entamoeba histolytica KU27]|uniref:Uncharacterized protein n=1 Tax=Entamoeba histolytica KU27 TaxID=885311 RepID=M2S7M5_ENTHI|nr:Hypothetical protein EHI5A_209240 [Entamoeba histolytica KU27]